MKIRTKIDRHTDRLDERWKALPLRKQRRYTLYFFMGYLLFTAGVLFSVWYNVYKPNKVMTIEHIENPVLQKNGSPARLQDTLSNNFKK